jgi:hypothetical protein
VRIAAFPTTQGAIQTALGHPVVLQYRLEMMGRKIQLLDFSLNTPHPQQWRGKCFSLPPPEGVVKLLAGDAPVCSGVLPVEQTFPRHDGVASMGSATYLPIDCDDW